MPSNAVHSNIAGNLARVRERIASACRRVGRAPSDVRLVAVTKYVDVEAIRALLSAGQFDFGENQVQQLTRRAAALGADLSPLHAPIKSDHAPQPRWHLIGSLQRNKVRALLPASRLVHSLDSVRLAEEIDARVSAIDATVEALLEVNIAGEVSKHGVAPDEAAVVLEAIRKLPSLKVRGLMCMAPLNPNPEAARPCFKALHDLGIGFQAQELLDSSALELSMGMSQDFEVAIEEGATLVRVGSALFDAPAP